MIFRYPGGKSKKNIKNWILSNSPEFQEYREPFVGGGSIFFSINNNKKRWINDLDFNLIEVYYALRDRPEEFITKCREIPPHDISEELPPPIYNQRLKNLFNYFSDNKECDQALRYFFINRTVWAGRVNYDIKSRLYFSVPEGWNIIKTIKLEETSKILNNTKITSLSYESLLLEPGNNCWIYCDPPYYKNTNLSKNSQLYKYNFSIEDHVLLSEIVKKSPHKVSISYDNEEFIKNLYKDFRIIENEWSYCGTSSAKKDSSKYNKKRKGKEILICNY